MNVYGKTISATVGSALIAAGVVAAVDVGWTLAGAGGVKGSEAALFAVVALALTLGGGTVLGLLEGVVVASVRRTHGSLLERLRDDATDRAATGALLATLATGAAYALAIAVLAMRLVAETERKSVGALLLGAAAAVAVPVFVLLGHPVYRVTRRLAGLVPRPRAIVASVAILLAALGAAGFVIMTRLDWRVLPLALPAAALGFVVVQGLALALWRRPWPGRVVGAAAGLALIGAVAAVLAARPNERTTALLGVESRFTRVLVGAVRGAFDRDNDGYAALLGGGDCNDINAGVHPGARDLPDNGVDENCLGGDAHKEAAPQQPKEPTPPAARKVAFDGNVLVIAVDTLRADRLGSTRRTGKSLTPRMDELVARGVLFRRTYAQAPNTPRSFPSLFLSRFPSQVVWDDPFRNYPVVKDENTTIWEALQAGGLRTVGVASHHYFEPERGITQGFVEFDNDGAKSIKDSNPDIASPRIVPRAVTKMGELARSGKRFALFVHLFEPHSTYVTHEEYPIQGKGTEGLVEKYDYEIAYVDRWVGTLLDGLRDAGVADKTMIVLLSDHGEAFGAHRVGGERMFFHGQTLYDELLRVPLVMVVPGVAPRAVDAPVMLVDVAPTLVDVLGVPRPASFVGASLAPALAGEPLPPRPVHAELLPAPSWNHHVKAMIDADGRTKVIYRVSDNVFELYDLGADPDEQQNVAATDVEKAARMKAAITRWMETEL